MTCVVHSYRSTSSPLFQSLAPWFVLLSTSCLILTSSLSQAIPPPGSPASVPRPGPTKCTSPDPEACWVAWHPRDAEYILWVFKTRVPELEHVADTARVLTDRTDTLVAATTTAVRTASAAQAALLLDLHSAQTQSATLREERDARYSLLEVIGLTTITAVVGAALGAAAVAVF
jgi:hypothetical protein